MYARRISCRLLQRRKESKQPQTTRSKAKVARRPIEFDGAFLAQEELEARLMMLDVLAAPRRYPEAIRCCNEICRRRRLWRSSSHLVVPCNYGNYLISGCSATMCLPSNVSLCGVSPTVRVQSDSLDKSAR